MFKMVLTGSPLMSGCWYTAFVYSIMAWAVTVALGIQRATGAVWPRVISKGFNNYATTPCVLNNYATTPWVLNNYAATPWLLNNYATTPWVPMIYKYMSIFNIIVSL